jgi:hypothetical protein
MKRAITCVKKSSDRSTNLKKNKITLILSFLERERDRDFVNVSDRDLAQYDRFRPFAPSQTIHRS